MPANEALHSISKKKASELLLPRNRKDSQLKKLRDIRLSLVDMYDVSLFHVFNGYCPRDCGCHKGQKCEGGLVHRRNIFKKVKRNAAMGI